jgi:Fic family protein
VNTKDFEGSKTGKCVKTMQGYYAFIPCEIRTISQAAEYNHTIVSLLSKADRLLGELSGTGRVIQNPYRLISPYIRREAVSSSSIEGTQSSLRDLFLYEAQEVKQPRIPDVKEVSNYVKALEEGIKLLDRLPISTRLICEMHGILMQGVRGEHATPGELRRSQNWIGPPGCTLNEATYVPPPVQEMKMALGDWEKFINADMQIPVLIQAAVTHYQFEAIHPFIDGNGRIGRLLIILLLLQKGCLTQPLLYLSEFFDKYRDEYYRLLLAVSQKGDIQTWIEFFLRGIIRKSEDALRDSRIILHCYEKYQNVIKSSKQVPESVYKLIDEIFKIPVVSISNMSNKLGVQYNSIKNGVLRLVTLGILQEVGGKKRNKIYVAHELLEILVSSSQNKT